MTPILYRATVGVVSDTHSLLRPEAVSALRGVDLIVHAGDVGKEEVLRGLQALAPVYAVRGNVDRGAWAHELPASELLELGKVKVYIYHGHEDPDLDPVAAGCRVIVSGHSHLPKLEERDGVLYLNPGSAGPKRFRLPATLAKLHVRGDALSAEFIDLA